MVEIAGSLRCLFTEMAETENGRVVIEIPRSEVDQKTLDLDEDYHIAIFAHSQDSSAKPQTVLKEVEHPSQKQSEVQSEAENDSCQGPPVSEGEQRTVTIETVGDQGDGIAKVERGYVVIVPDTAPGDEVQIRITAVQENVAFAEKI